MLSLSNYCAFVCLFAVVYCDCKISINKDFGKPQPVLLKNGEFLSLNAETGHIKLKRSENITLACTGRDNAVVLGNQSAHVDIVVASCIMNTTFHIGKWKGHLRNITCSKSPWFTAEPTRDTCYGHNNKFVRVGYKVRDVFHKLYSVCFDRGLLSTLYTKHELTQKNIFLQTAGTRSSFIEGDFFGGVRMSMVYRAQNQKTRFNEILGEGADKKYITKNQYLTRGHLAARADFSLAFEQRASYHYLNTVPQWRRGNAGDWAALEDGLRRRVHKYGPVTVYTGGYEVLSLPDARGCMKEIYLAADENNNDVVPVPLYNYKLVYDEKNKTATAFISINTSYYNETMTNKLMFCEDICERNPDFAWLTWRADGTTSFCCDYEEFKEKIKHLPELDVEGTFF